jgi:adenosine 3'-phospho 5'-phosphosulfate transporter B2
LPKICGTAPKKAESQDVEMRDTRRQQRDEEENVPLTVGDREEIDSARPHTAADLDPLAVRNKYLKYLFCFLGLQVSYVLWGITQENLMTTEYKFGKFTSSSFCVFGNRFLALIVALCIVMYRQASAKTSMKDVPFYYYAPSSLSNTLSSWAQYEALKYLSFPIQVLSKSCKVIPVMLVMPNFLLFSSLFN